MSDLTISHTHADGTRLVGSTRGDGVLEIVRRYGFQCRRGAGIHIAGSRDRRARTDRIDGAKAALEEAGHTVTLSIDDTYRPEADVVADRADRAADRADRYAAMAATATARSEAAGRASDEIAGRRPFGQPILIGHHSEGRARRDLARINALDERRWAEADRANHYANRAQAALSNEAHKHRGPAVMRRIGTREADRRAWARTLAEATSDEARARYQEEIDHLDDQLAYDRAILTALEEAGTFVAWRAEHFQPGDKVRIWGHLWLPVKRVNVKSVSVVDQYGHTQTVRWDDLSGRRRDGQQWDTPNGQPWPVATAVAVARWAGLVREADSTSYDEDRRRRARYVDWAQRLGHGLPLTASDAEVRAFATADKQLSRDLAVHFLGIFDRLEAGETASAIAATITPAAVTPAWQMPAGDPADMRAPDVRAGDIVKGLWDRGYGGRTLWPHFAGPVAVVSGIERRGERGDWVRIELVDGTVREFQTHQWLAVYRAGDAP